MKKLLFLSAAALMISIGVYNLNDEASFKKLNTLPYSVQENINPELRLQQIYRKDHSFIVFHSSGIVEHKLQVEGNMVKMLLSISDQETSNDIQQYSYKLKTGEEHEKIAVFVDGQLIPFDEVVAGR
ncbi:MAG: hypothetical protein ACQEV0_01160 [Bacillota bacterium]